MAYLKSFKRLIAAKKVLRLFATKIRFNKLQRSKTTRRILKKHPKTTNKGGSSSWLSLSFQSRFKRKRKEVHRYPRKKTKPVYVDQLFLDKNKLETPVVDRRENAMVGTSGKVVGCVADDLWESLVMCTSQMDGINERADEFISRFRADLLNQEMSASRF